MHFLLEKEVFVIMITIIYKFNIHRSVHRNIFLQYNQQDAPVISNYLFLHNALHVSHGLSVHYQELKTAYTATVYVKQLLLSVAIGDEMELGSSISSPIAAGSMELPSSI